MIQKNQLHWFFYTIIESDNDNKYPLNYGKEILKPNMELNKINNFTIGNNTLPLTTDLTLWGKILNHKLNKLIIKKINSKFIYEIYRYTREISYNLIKIKDSNNSTIIWV